MLEANGLEHEYEAEAYRVGTDEEVDLALWFEDHEDDLSAWLHKNAEEVSVEWVDTLSHLCPTQVC